LMDLGILELVPLATPVRLAVTSNSLDMLPLVAEAIVATSPLLSLLNRTPDMETLTSRRRLRRGLTVDFPMPRTTNLRTFTQDPI
jgi:hypothetical protein